DMRGELGGARKRAEHTPLAELLQSVRPLESVVAGRHSQQSGTLRAFERRYVDRHTPALTSNSGRGRGTDGVVLLSLEADDWRPEVDPAATENPVILGVSGDVASIAEVAREHAAHSIALQSATARNDWVAERELRERLAVTAYELDQSMFRAFSPAAAH